MMMRNLAVAGGVAALALGLGAPAASAAPADCANHPEAGKSPAEILETLEAQNVETFREAAKARRSTIRDLNRYLFKSVRCARVTFRLATEEDRDAFKLVRRDESASDEDKASARAAYREATRRALCTFGVEDGASHL